MRYCARRQGDPDDRLALRARGGRPLRCTCTLCRTPRRPSCRPPAAASARAAAAGERQARGGRRRGRRGGRRRVARRALSRVDELLARRSSPRRFGACVLVQEEARVGAPRLSAAAAQDARRASRSRAPSRVAFGRARARARAHHRRVVGAERPEALALALVGASPIPRPKGDLRRTGRGDAVLNALVIPTARRGASSMPFTSRARVAARPRSTSHRWRRRRAPSLFGPKAGPVSLKTENSHARGKHDEPLDRRDCPLERVRDYETVGGRTCSTRTTRRGVALQRN